MNKTDELVEQISDAIHASLDGIEKDSLAVLQLGYIILGPHDPTVNALNEALKEPSPRGNPLTNFNDADWRTLKTLYERYGREQLLMSAALLPG